MATLNHIIAIVFGMLIGSFLSVCIYRIPLYRASGIIEEEGFEEEEPEEDEAEDLFDFGEDEEMPPLYMNEKRISISYPPRSFCPKCETQLYWWHNIPVISWLILFGKCHFCKAPIPARYPTVEALTATMSYLCYTQHGFSLTAFVLFAFCCSLIVISFIDIDYFIIPDLISKPAAYIAIGLVALNQYFELFALPICPNLEESAWGLLMGAGFLWGISKAYQIFRRKIGLGFGDVKLLMMTGLLLGWKASLYTIFFGSLIGSFFGLTFILLGQRKMSQYIPFGPYLALATVLYIFTDTFLFEVFAYMMMGKRAAFLM